MRRRAKPAGEAPNAGLILISSADLAASMLGVALLLLIVVLLFRQEAPPATGPQTEAEITDLFVIVSGRPLQGDEATEVLRQRLANPLWYPVVDVMPEAVRIAGPGIPERLLDVGSAPQALRRFFRQIPGDRPVILYVFDHGLYPEVRAALDTARHDWIELSPPEALRQADGTGGSDWSDAFRDMERPAQTPGRFRTALRAHLEDPNRGFKTRSDSQDRVSLLDRIVAALRLIIAILAFLLSGLAIFLVERRRLKRLRYGD